MDSKLHCVENLRHTHLLALILRGSRTSRLLMKCPIGKRRETAIKDNLHCWEKNRKGVQRFKKSHLKARESIGERIQRPVDQMMGRRRKALSRETTLVHQELSLLFLRTAYPRTIRFYNHFYLFLIITSYLYHFVLWLYMSVSLGRYYRKKDMSKRRRAQILCILSDIQNVMINVLDACYI